MHYAFLLLKLKVGPIDEVLRRLSEIPNIKETHIVLGDYDIITFIEAETKVRVGIVIASISKLVNIRSLHVLNVITKHVRCF